MEHAQAEANHRAYVEFLARLVDAMRETAGGDEPGGDASDLKRIGQRQAPLSGRPARVILFPRGHRLP